MGSPGVGLGPRLSQTTRTSSSLLCRIAQCIRPDQDRQSSIILAARAGKSGATTFGCGSPDTGSGALPGRVSRPAARPALCAPIVSQTCAAIMQQAEG